MNKVMIILLSTMLQSCTYSVTIVHTQGTASDVVDEEQTPSADIDADIKVSPV